MRKGTRARAIGARAIEAPEPKRPARGDPEPERPAHEAPEPKSFVASEFGSDSEAETVLALGPPPALASELPQHPNPHDSVAEDESWGPWQPVQPAGPPPALASGPNPHDPVGEEETVASWRPNPFDLIAVDDPYMEG